MSSAEPNPTHGSLLTRYRVSGADSVTSSFLVAQPAARVAAIGAPRRKGAVLAIHGFASSAERGWGRTGHLAALTRAGRTVVAVDLRGHGESDKPHDAAAYSVDAVLADLLAVVTRIPDWLPGMTRRADPYSADDRGGDGAGGRVSDDGASVGLDVIGYSLGSRLAFTAASRRVFPIRRMVLGGFDGRPLFADIESERLERYAAGGPDNDRVALRALVEGLAGTGDGADPSCLPPEPTLVVAGTDDRLANGAERFAATLPHGTFLAIPGRDHVSAVPSGAYRRALVDFLAD